MPWEIIKEIYKAVLLYGFNISIERGEWIIRHPEECGFWYIDGSQWVKCEKDDNFIMIYKKDL